MMLEIELLLAKFPANREAAFKSLVPAYIGLISEGLACSMVASRVREASVAKAL